MNKKAGHFLVITASSLIRLTNVSGLNDKAFPARDWG